jgi:DNA polymerase-3 subunit epsilon
MNLCFIDVETTGTDPVKNGIIQISGQLIVDEKLGEPFDFKVRPYPGDIIEDAALSVSGAKREQLVMPVGASGDQIAAWELETPYKDPIRTRGKLLDVLGEHVNKFDRTSKYWFVAYNASFDYQFLRQWFEKAGDKYFGSWFWWPALDVAVIAALAIGDGRAKMRDFKLATVAGTLGLDLDPTRLHDAAYDIEVTRHVFSAAIETYGKLAAASAFVCHILDERKLKEN